MNATKTLLFSIAILVAATFANTLAQTPVDSEDQVAATNSATPAETATASPVAQPPAPLKVSAYPRYFSSYSNPLTRNPAILLRFNTAVDPATITAQAHLIDDKRRPLPIIATPPHRRPDHSPAKPGAPADGGKSESRTHRLSAGAFCPHPARRRSAL